MHLGRRQVLLGTTALSVAGGVLPRIVRAAPALGAINAFSMDWLIERGRALAQQPFVPLDEQIPAEIAGLSYDQYRKIRYREEESLWRDANLPFWAQFFHLGSFFDKPVHLFEVVGGAASEILYDQRLFDLDDNRFETHPSEYLGFAGFRVLSPFNTSDKMDELAVFLGASYFRALGRGSVYGLSARGLAIDTGSEQGEEFPVFRQFWLERPAPDATELTIYALLDSSGACGAYAFTIRPGDTTVIEVNATVFARHPIEQLGIAPMTSMFLFGPADDRGFDDFRPEVHDSDGLAMWTGPGEWIWRPLRNPHRLLISAFMDDNPRGFGLMQRCRAFEQYQDLEARYESRPSLWVEPMTGWGPGAVQLVEIPTDLEIHDNIVAFWVPRAPVEAGSEWRLSYRLHWGADPPFRSERGRVIATRSGRGGVSGTDDGVENRKYVIDFKGGPLDLLAADAEIEAVVTASTGTVLFPVAQHNPEIEGWRAFFDHEPAGEEPADLRCYLRHGDDALTETWSFQWTP